MARIDLAASRLVVLGQTIAVGPGTSYDDAKYIILAESLASGEGYQLINFPRPQIERNFPPGWPLALQLLFYPGTGGHQDTPSHKTFAQGFLLEEAHITYFFGHYLRGPQDRDDWRFAPLNGVDDAGHVRDLDGVAPAWIGLAECDPLTDEGVQYADRLRLAGVPVDLEIYAGVVHGFIQFGRAIPSALTAHNDAARALRQAFGDH